MVGKRTRLFFVVIMAAMAITACDADTRRAVGISKTKPDEFKVLSRPSLAVPPEFRLDPPQDTNKPNYTLIRTKAKEELLGDKNTSKQAGLSKGEQVLLGKTKVDDNPDIRSIIEEENRPIEALIEEDEEKGFLDTLIDPIIGTTEEPLVDADAEQARIDQNKAEGKPITEGETPVKEPEEKSVLRQLID